jgi:hypothetical protein
VRAVAATLDPTTGPSRVRQASFDALLGDLQASRDPMRHQMVATMSAFAPGLFVGGDAPDLPRDNLDLERFFRTPKGHERRIHGHRHAGVRLVHQGPTLLLALDAHVDHPTLFCPQDLRAYAHAPVPASQQASQRRHHIMRQARSPIRRPLLLARLEEQYARLVVPEDTS